MPDVSLDQDQQVRRRELLDFYGQFAQLSILLLPLLCQLYFGIGLIVGRFVQPKAYSSKKIHQSPLTSKGTKLQGAKNTQFVGHIRWRLDDEPIAGWGLWRHWIMAMAWGLWLFFLVTKDTGNDYLHITKRFGIVAASQLPFHYLLALKSWSPIQYFTRMSHEELNPYHRSLGRIITVFFVCHATLYLNFYIQMGLLMKRIQDRDVILGLCAVTSAIVLFSAALSRVRDYSYRVFFYLHNTLSMLLLPILYFHVAHLRVYILEAAAVYAFLVLQRNKSQQSHEGTIATLRDSKLLSVTIALSDRLATRSYAPGQHVYLAFPRLTQKLRLNPFTIANLPKEDGKIQLYIRPLKGTTAMLEDLSHHPQPVTLSIEGPYGSAAYFPDLSGFDSVLLVAGGVGATFTMPFYRTLLRRKQEGSWTGRLHHLWTVKHFAEASWGTKMVEDASTRDTLEIYVTSQRRGEPDQPSREVEGIELEERDALLGREEEDDRIISDKSEIYAVKRGRPDLRKSVDEIFSQVGVDKVAVLVCGPGGLAASLRKEVRRWVAEGTDVFWHNEEFGW